MIKNVYRSSLVLLFIISLFVLSASFYFQYGKGLAPCPLCIMQRVCVMVSLLLSLVGIFLYSPRAQRTILILECIIAVAGLYFAMRQLWLQSLPADQLPACLPGLEVLMRYFPWQDILHALIWGAADCGEITWQWLGLSMPAWSSLFFIGLFLLSLLNIYSLYRSRIKLGTY